MKKRLLSLLLAIVTVGLVLPLSIFTTVAGAPTSAADSVILLEYIESRGQSALDTGIYASSATKWVLDAQFTNTAGLSYNGAYQSSGLQRFDIAVDSGFRMNYGPVNAVVNHDTSRHTFVIDATEGTNGKWHIDSRSGTYSAKYDTPMDVSVALFARHFSSGYGYLAFEKVYSSQFYENGSLILDLRPCMAVESIPASLVSTGEAVAAGQLGMLDTVSGKFYPIQDNVTDIEPRNSTPRGCALAGTVLSGEITNMRFSVSPSASSPVSGRALSYIIPSCTVCGEYGGKTVTIPGAITWDDPSLSAVIGNSYNVTFTPSLPGLGELKTTVTVTLEESDYRYSFAVLSDIHQTEDGAHYYGGDQFLYVKEYFTSALDIAKRYGVSFVATAGDMTVYAESGSASAQTHYASDLQTVYNIGSASGIGILACAGNHDYYLSNDAWTEKVLSLRPTDLTYNACPKNPKTYSTVFDSDLYLFIAPDSGGATSKSAYTYSIPWAISQIEANPDKKVFVFIHFSLPGYTGLSNGKVFGFTTDSTQDDDLVAAINAHGNVTVYTGHTHVQFEHESAYPNIIYQDKNNNATLADGVATVHVPTLSDDSSYHNNPEGYLVDVYKDCVVMRGINFLTGELLTANTYTNNYSYTTTVSFDVQDHGTSVDDVEAWLGVPKPTDPNELGWCFAGWYKEPECINAWDFINDTVSGEPITLYAKWYETDFGATSLSLKDNTWINVYTTLTDDAIASLHFTYTINGVETAVSPSMISKTSYGWRVSISLLPYQLADDVTVKMFDSSNNMVSTTTDSVRGYCGRALAETQDVDLARALRALLNYGAAVQLWQNYHTENLANSILLP